MHLRDVVLLSRCFCDRQRWFHHSPPGLQQRIPAVLRRAHHVQGASGRHGARHQLTHVQRLVRRHRRHHPSVLLEGDAAKMSATGA